MVHYLGYNSTGQIISLFCENHVEVKLIKGLFAQLLVIMDIFIGF